MKKLSLLLLVAVVLAGSIYAVQAFADKSSNEVVSEADKATVQETEQVADQAAQCPKHPDCPANCNHDGKCTSDCPRFVDNDGDGQCDTQGKCHSTGTHEGCPGHATNTQQGCPGHTGGGCGRH